VDLAVVEIAIAALLLGAAGGYALARFRLRHLEERWRSFVTRHRQEAETATARADDLARQLEAAREGTEQATLAADLSEARRLLAEAEQKAALLAPEVDALHALLTRKEQQILALTEEKRLLEVQLAADRPEPPEDAAMGVKPRVSARSSTGPAANSRGHDDLTQIQGIGHATERRLKAAGIVSYAQLAALDHHAVLALAPRVKSLPAEVDKWVEQAAGLVAAGDQG
jgi:predicted flap endonuclease-1-like 5' DNA nuclease